MSLGNYPTWQEVTRPISTQIAVVLNKALMAENQKNKIWKNFVFNIEPPNLAPTPMFAAGTDTYAQISDPGSLRRGTEVEATRDFGPEIWTKT